MATIVTVHGTFAHMGGAIPEPTDLVDGAPIRTKRSARGTVHDLPSGTPPAETTEEGEKLEAPVVINNDQAVKAAAGLAWWQPGSPFEKRLRELISSGPSPLKYRSFVWNGDNSELSRRRAGWRLYRQLQRLDETGEKYALIGHSHGGSVIAHALLMSASQKKPLQGLHSWVTVGTPFVHLRKERFLFMRLPLIWKAMFVASLMLLFMLLFFLLGSLFDGRIEISETRRLTRYAIVVALTTLPFIVFYILARIIDSRRLSFYRKSTRKRARAYYEDKWHGLAHRNDEALNGLGSLSVNSPPIFHKTFAVPFFSLLSAFILPVAYLWVVTSPALMTSIDRFLRANVYAMDGYEEKKQVLDAERRELRNIRRQLRQAREKREDAGTDLAARLEAEETIANLRQQLSTERQRIDEKVGNVAQVQRITRYERRFLRNPDGTPCEGNALCDQGRNIILNGQLLFFLVTDEFSSLIVDEELRSRPFGNLIRIAIPILLVPVIFGLAAIAIVLLVQSLAHILSAALSKVLDYLTWFEVTRSALGNDTETEVALRASPSPDWIEAQMSFLPDEIADKLTENSNQVTAESLAKFREKISDIILPNETENAANLLSFLTWQELIHTSYFEVEAFRNGLARVLVEAGPFEATGELQDNREARAVAAWLATLPPSGPPAPTAS